LRLVAVAAAAAAQAERDGGEDGTSDRPAVHPGEPLDRRQTLASQPEP
jgi:hypothetical protein